MKFFKSIIAAYEESGKKKTLQVLRGMPERQLRDAGISPELLSQGVKAWPWAAQEDENVAPILIDSVSISKIAPAMKAEAQPEAELEKSAA